MKTDVFISYSTKDKNIANAICSKLETNAIKCWIAPRDIMPGDEYGGAIVSGIEEASLFLVIVSQAANDSQHVKREVERAISKGKIIIPFKVEEFTLSKTLEYSLTNCHWLDAINEPLNNHIITLNDVIISFLKKDHTNKSTLNNSSNTTSVEEAIAFEISWTTITVIGGLYEKTIGIPYLTKLITQLGLKTELPLNRYFDVDDGGTSVMNLMQSLGGSLLADRPSVAMHFQAGMNLILDTHRNAGTGIEKILEDINLPQELRTPQEDKLKWVDNIHHYFLQFIR